MSKTPSEISADIIAKLNYTDSQLSLAIGTPERKIVDAVAEVVAESQIDTYLVSTQLDINTKSGKELEEFVSIYGYGRLKGRQASGTITFTLATAPIQSVQIPSGTSVFTTVGSVLSSVTFTTQQAGIIPAGSTQVTLPILCTVTGTVGNVQAGAITGVANTMNFDSVTNLVPATGGTDDETDDQLRERFKKTFLRNIAGTADFYLALVLQANGVRKGNVLGPYNWYVEMLELDGVNPVASTNLNSKYIWTSGWALSLNKGNIDEKYYIPGIDYTVNLNVQPTEITPIHADLTAAGVHAFFEHQYTSLQSRNDPYFGITNKVDVYMDGVQAVGVTETYVTPSTNLTYGSGLGVNDAVNFRRADGAAMPTSGTFRVMRLASTPVVSFPSTIIVGATTYTLGTHYVGIIDDTDVSGTERSRDGVLFHTGSQPTAAQTTTISYSYNRLPEILNSLVKSSKQITTDVMVHAAKTRTLLVNLVVVYDNNASIALVNTQINSAVSNYLNSLSFGSWIQFSDLAAIVHSVKGVDNARVAKTTDGVAASMQYKIGSNVIASYNTDFKLEDGEIAALHSVVITRKSPNTFVA